MSKQSCVVVATPILCISEVSVSVAGRTCPGRRASVVYEIKRCLPTPITGSSWIKRDSSEKRTRDLWSRGGGLKTRRRPTGLF
jgi:hypothetical protein